MTRFFDTLRGWLGFKPAAPQRQTKPSLLDDLTQAISAPIVPPARYPKPKTKTITVKAGDTLFGLAQAHDATVQAIVQANNLTPASKLVAGQSLVIPLPAEPPTPPARPTLVRVGRRDTLASIARRMGLPPEALAEANNLRPLAQPLAGQWLFVPPAEPPHPEAPSPPPSAERPSPDF